MTRLAKRIAIVVCGIVLVPVLLVAVSLIWFESTSVPSEIIGFHPTSFDANATAKFFYSIGDELKYSSEITMQSPTLLRGRVQESLVSPDQTKIAVVANGKLFIVFAGGEPPQEVTAVDSIYREPKPIGQQFFRDDDFQWSKDSSGLYLIKDEYYESTGSQLFSLKGELWRYDLTTGKLQSVLKPFPAYTYFLGKGTGVYFSVPTEKGDLRLRYFDGQNVRDIGEVGAGAIAKGDLALGSAEEPFFSFSAKDYNGLYTGAITEVITSAQGPETIVIGDQAYLTLKQGQGIKGPYYCSDVYNSRVLPGNRYYLLSFNCGNYDGQLLLDTTSGKYMRLPKDTRVYLTLNTDDVSHYRITGGGMMAK